MVINTPININIVVISQSSKVEVSGLTLNPDDVSKLFIRTYILQLTQYEQQKKYGKRQEKRENHEKKSPSFMNYFYSI